jgi:hypothetical protein
MADMSVKLVTINELVHTYAAEGYLPDAVRSAAIRFLDLLGISMFGGTIYQVHAVELAAFQLYLVREVMPDWPELHALRVDATLHTVTTLFDSWGDTELEVTARLFLDSVPAKDITEIARVVEELVSSCVDAMAVTFLTDGVRVDGVQIRYPEPVASAIFAAATRALATSARSPF